MCLCLCLCLCLWPQCVQWSQPSGSPLVQSFQRMLPQVTGGSSADDGEDDLDDTPPQRPQSILIPARDGSIIFYGTSGMQKLPHDARRLAAACPVTTETMHFVGGKESQLFGLDARTGDMHRSYRSSHGVR